MSTIEMHGDHHSLRLSRERPSATFSGYPMLLVLLGTVALTGWGLRLVPGPDPTLGIVIAVLGIIGLLFVSAGFYLLQPNQAAAILLFGDYRGTDRHAGLRWRLPWLTRTKI